MEELARKGENVICHMPHCCNTASCTRDQQIEAARSSGLAGAGSTRTEEEEEEQCAVCRMEFEPDEEVALLPCKHLYHGECIAQWLKDRKVRPFA